jgi:hypothetical protein
MPDHVDDWLVHCPTCGRTRFVKLADVAKLMRADGPKCCGQTMTWYTKADPLPPLVSRDGRSAAEQAGTQPKT